MRRSADNALVARIRELKAEAARETCNVPQPKCGVDPLALVGALRRGLPEDGLLFTDVTVSEHLAEHYRVCQPRTYFNPVDNQAMGWSIPATIGAQRVHYGRTVATLTGGARCADERAGLALLPVRTCPSSSLCSTMRDPSAIADASEAGVFADPQRRSWLSMDYKALAQALGVAYVEVTTHAELDGKIRAAVCHNRPC